MKLLPFDRFTLICPKSADEIEAALSPYVSKPKFFEMRLGAFEKPPAQPFQGSITREGFKIWPHIRYRNSFLPIVVGGYEPHLSGTKIHVTQRLHVFALGFAVVWTFLAFGFGGAFVIAPPDPAVDKFLFDPRLVPYLMLFFFWAMAMGGFWWEARKTPERLSKILDAELDQGF